MGGRAGLSRRGLLVGFAVLAMVGATGLFATFRGPGSLRSYLRDNYTLVSSEENGRTLEFASSDSPTATAQRIASRWKPAERLIDPAGLFLRYRDDMVVVTSDGSGGSRIHVDDDRGGYARWYPYVGGYWGTFSGRGETFRGGGPGAGK